MNGWVLKNEAGEYLYVDTLGSFGFTRDAEWALHFLREVDAQRFQIAEKGLGATGLVRDIEGGHKPPRGAR